MPVSEPDTPHTPPPDFMPRKEMSCKACDIKFLNFNTWKQHQIVVHDMSIKDWTLVYEQRDALKRNRAQKRYALCLSRNPPIRPRIFKKLFGSERSPTDIIFVNHIDGSNTSMVDNELLAWHEYKRCSAHYDHWFASKQMQIHCSLIEVAAVNTMVDEGPGTKPAPFGETKAVRSCRSRLCWTPVVTPLSFSVACLASYFRSTVRSRK